MAMDKYSTPERKGTCQSCGSSTQVVPVDDSDNEKIASPAEEDDPTTKYLCEDCRSNE